MTEDQLKQKRKEFSDSAREFHRPLLENMGISTQYFKAKPSFFLRTGEQVPGIKSTDAVVGIYDSEAEARHDLYIELYSKTIDPLPGRPLYRYKYDPDYKDNLQWYNGKSYLIKLEDLEVVNKIVAAEMGQPEIFREPEPKPQVTVQPAPTQLSTTIVNQHSEIVPIMNRKVSDLTVRELMAIVKQKATSGNHELDMYIINS